ncbi:DUF1616 domain-containing protein [Natrinema altunense]|uniref:DUF1616 domain-containing protein n=1 Tax=Natrinema altunense (strain JCM 12890 / CGMCC 1.3731 / AJ2) TaxID=1227494 RepID=L9ZY43_NATA2|nr:DUF1616 domain-containing protein [Natrinema altunense]ELY90053.1 hypothetical protein C485_03358 [Natrinema altunense JCM 12890]
MSDTHWWFFDLAVAIAVTGVLTFGILAGGHGLVRIAVTIPLVLFLPGYALVSALFPDEPNDDYRTFDEEKTGLGSPVLVSGGLEAIERTVLSVVLSVAIVPAITLFATVTPGGVTLEPVLSGLAVVTVVLALLAIGARYRCPPDRRFTPSLSSVTPFFTRGRPSPYERSGYRPYNVAIGIGLVLLLASGGFALANPPQHDGFTELSVGSQNVTGDTETMYDSTYTAGEQQELQATITNQEHDERTYTTVVLLQRVSDDGTDVTVRESTEVDRRTATVPDGVAHRQSLEITPTMRGNDLRLTVLLYDGEPPAEPTADNAYRVARLPIEVE